METNYLPDDLLFPLLSKLPVKSLLRFLCVSKSWNSLIKSPAFVSEHIRRQINCNTEITTDQNSYLLYIPDPVEGKSNQVCTILHENDAPPSHVNLPCSSGDNIVGVCEGLICLMIENIDHNNYYIWNPLLGTLKVVPPSITSHETERLVFGFGFTNINDYRIVKIIYDDLWFLHEAEMYSSRTNTWRRLECRLSPTWSIRHHISGVFFQGSIYWLSQANPDFQISESIVRFDLEKEIFEEMEAPWFDRPTRKSQLVVANGRFLVLVVVHWRPMKGLYVHVWEKKGSKWISSSTRQLIIPDQKYTKLSTRNDVELTKSGHILVHSTKPEPVIDDMRVFTYDHNGVRGRKWREVKVSSWTSILNSTYTEEYLVRVKETLFLFNDEQTSECLTAK